MDIEKLTDKELTNLLLSIKNEQEKRQAKEAVQYLDKIKAILEEMTQKNLVLTNCGMWVEPDSLDVDVIRD